MGMQTDIVLETRALTCLRGRRLVFEGVALALGAGGALVLTGPNGAGKSSLLRVLAGLIEPLAGEIRWHGVPIVKDRETYRARLAFVGHLDAVKPAATVRESLRFWADLSGGAAARVADALAALALEPLAEVRGAELSAGQKRRVALARLLVADRPLWLLDEPATGLDAASVARLETMIADHRAAGGLVVASTHGGLAIPEAVGLDIGRFQAEEAACGP